MKLKTLSKYIVAGLALAGVTSGVQAEELDVQKLNKSGNSLGTVAVDSGKDTFVNDDRTVFKVASDTTNASTVTITLQRERFSSSGFGTISFDTLTVNVSDETKYIRAAERIYNNDTGRVEADYSGATSNLEVAVFKRPRD